MTLGFKYLKNRRVRERTYTVATVSYDINKQTNEHYTSLPAPIYYLIFTFSTSQSEMRLLLNLPSLTKFVELIEANGYISKLELNHSQEVTERTNMQYRKIILRLTLCLIAFVVFHRFLDLLPGGACISFFFSF